MVFQFNLPYNYISIVIKEQQKDLTHMFYLRIPCYKLYKENLFFYVFTLKYMCHFSMSSKKLDLWLLFSSLSLVFFYLLT